MIDSSLYEQTLAVNTDYPYNHTMKTTLILPDQLMRQVKSRAALEGCSLSKYVERCLEQSLENDRTPQVENWLSLLPELPPQALREVEQTLNDSGFDQIDPEMWA